jgi:hypothetical protein
MLAVCVPGSPVAPDSLLSSLCPQQPVPSCLNPIKQQVGYCQGLNFVAGLLLMYVGERHAFAGLVVLMQDRGLRTYYSTDMALLQVCGVA